MLNLNAGQGEHTRPIREQIARMLHILCVSLVSKELLMTESGYGTIAAKLLLDLLVIYRT